MASLVGVVPMSGLFTSTVSQQLVSIMGAQVSHLLPEPYYGTMAAKRRRGIA